MGWRLLESKTGWGRIIRDKYLENTYFRYDLLNKDLLGDSKVRNNILNNMILLRKDMRWLIKNGKKIRFWEDN